VLHIQSDAKARPGFSIIVVMSAPWFAGKSLIELDDFPMKNHENKVIVQFFSRLISQMDDLYIPFTFQ
jgi:hypothetical protein